VSGVEALVRWKHLTKGFIPPDYLVPFAEKFNLIDDLTSLVVEKVFSWCRDWRIENKPMNVSINLSQMNLADLDLSEKLIGAAAKYHVSASDVTFEITETSLPRDPDHVLDVLTRLCLKRFQLSIVDFGTGHLSLAYLSKMPFRELKIDKMWWTTATQIVITESS